MRVRRVRRLAAAACSIFFALLASCETSPWYEHRFIPAPLEAEVATEAVPGAQARVLVTVLGIARAHDHVRDHVLVRMRLENIGSVAAKLVPESLSLVSADLKPFGPASSETAEMKEIPPGGDTTVDFAIPLPEGKRPDDLDLSGLNLRFSVAFGDQKVTTGMTFQRVDWRYGDPYSNVHVGVGMGWYHVH